MEAQQSLENLIEEGTLGKQSRDSLLGLARSLNLPTSKQMKKEDVVALLSKFHEERVAGSEREEMGSVAQHSPDEDLGGSLSGADDETSNGEVTVSRAHESSSCSRGCKTKC